MTKSESKDGFDYEKKMDKRNEAIEKNRSSTIDEKFTENLESLDRKKSQILYQKEKGSDVSLEDFKGNTYLFKNKEIILLNLQ